MKCTTPISYYKGINLLLCFTEEMLSTVCSQPINKHSKSAHARHRTLLMDNFNLKLPINLIKIFLELHCNLRLLLFVSPPAPYSLKISNYIVA